MLRAIIHENRYQQQRNSIVLIMIAKTSQIMFKNLILFFRLIIRLKMKNNIKFTFNFRVITQN